jgi:autophagy-related protein 2
VSRSPPDRWLSPLQGDTDEVLLFACSNSALQRGNGGGGNVLAVGLAGITVTYVSWPGRERQVDDFIIANVKGCTVVAYGGRLDWANAVAAFFDPSEALRNKDTEQAQSPPVVKDQLRKFFLLDLHDAALGYEPGLEALSAPEASAVACVLAAAAVRISSGDSVHPDQEQYDVRLRDVALHVLDLEFKKQAQFTYSTDSMRHTGFVQVLFHLPAVSSFTAVLLFFASF